MDSTCPRLPMQAAPAAPGVGSDSRAVGPCSPAFPAEASRPFVLLGGGYLVALLVAEWCTRLAPEVGLLAYGAVLLLLLLHTALCWDRPLRYLPLFLAATPSSRLIMLLVWPDGVPGLYLALGIPALAAVALFFFVSGRGLLSNLRLRVRSGWSLLVRYAERAGHILAVPWVALSTALFLSTIVAALFIVHPGGAGGEPRPAAPASLLAANSGPALGGALSQAVPRAQDRPAGLHSYTRGGGQTRLPAPRSLAGVTGRVLAPELGSTLSAATQEEEDDPATWRRLKRNDRLLPHPSLGAQADEYPRGCPATGYGNPYPRGVCTWYAREKRPDMPGFSGDYGMALNWSLAAILCGFRVDQEPEEGAVIVFPPGANGASSGGHVGYVEEVSEDAILISECNVTLDPAYSLEPWWWEDGYACAYRRIPFSWMDPGVHFIHEKTRERPAPPGQ